MTAMNVVHMRVKPGKEDEFIAIHRDFVAAGLAGNRKFSVVATGERMFTIVGEWESLDALVESFGRDAQVRPKLLNT